jgi:DNA-binding NarL/FixJ family response regulator
VRLPNGNGLDLIPFLRATNRQAALLILSAEDVSGGGHAMIRAALTKVRMDNDQFAHTIGRLLAKARQELPEGEPGWRPSP